MLGRWALDLSDVTELGTEPVRVQLISNSTATLTIPVPGDDYEPRIGDLWVTGVLRPAEVPVQMPGWVFVSEFPGVHDVFEQRRGDLVMFRQMVRRLPPEPAVATLFAPGWAVGMIRVYRPARGAWWRDITLEDPVRVEVGKRYGIYQVADPPGVRVQEVTKGGWSPSVDGEVASIRLLRPDGPATAWTVLFFDANQEGLGPPYDPGVAYPSPDAPVWQFYYGRNWGGPVLLDATSVSGLTWQQSRDQAVASLDAFMVDECDDCREAAAPAVQDLTAAAPGTRSHTQIDGYDFVVAPMPGV